MPLSTCRTASILQSVLHIADRADPDGGDTHTRLEALARHFQNEDGGYRSFTFSEYGSTQIHTVEFSDLSGDPAAAGRAIQTKIAGALTPALLGSVGLDPAMATDAQIANANRQAEKIALLIGDGSLQQAITQPVNDQLYLGKPDKMSVNVTVSRGDTSPLPSISLCHSATWEGAEKKTHFQTDLITNLALHESSGLAVRYEGRVYADSSVKPGVLRGIIETIRHYLTSLGERNKLQEQPGNVEIATSSMEHEARIDYLRGDRTDETTLSALHDRARFSSRAMTSARVMTAALHDEPGDAIRPTSPPRPRRSSPEARHTEATQTTTYRPAMSDGRARSKTRPYISAKHSAVTNLNGKANFADGGKIMCRHFAIWWLNAFRSNNGKIPYENISTTKGVAENITRRMEKSFDSELALSDAALVSHDCWGSQIESEFMDMESKEETLRTISIATTNHAMVLGLKIKSDSSGKTYVVEFYDPNDTTSHRRVAYDSSNRARIGALTARDLLSQRKMNRYFPDAGQTSIFFAKHDAGSGSIRRMQLPAGPPTADAIYYLLKYSRTETLAEQGERLARLPPAQRFACLAAADSDRRSGLFYALLFGHGSTCAAYGQLIANSGLSSEEKMGLLSAMGNQEAPAIHLALASRKADIVTRYGILLRASGLSREQKLQLLQVKNAKDETALLIAERRSDPAAIAIRNLRASIASGT